MSYGRQPGQGDSWELIEGKWAWGLSAGTNMQYQNGITAKASGSATVYTQLPALCAFFSIDTCATNGDAVALPAAVPGTWLTIYNNTATTSLSVYAFQGMNNGSLNNDTINNSSNSTAYSIATHVAVVFFCAKVGQWGAIKSA